MRNVKNTSGRFFLLHMK